MLDLGVAESHASSSCGKKHAVNAAAHLNGARHDPSRFDRFYAPSLGAIMILRQPMFRAKIVLAVVASEWKVNFNAAYRAFRRLSPLAAGNMTCSYF